ncbi:hypothetical protein BJY52DRAFT_1204836 [Lactarius psammicola]|nr:hypothetical protein BJY52DRAFT_1204836 [Lactarius psammicola]
MSDDTRTTYYNGITRDGDHPELVYRSDFLTTLFPKPVGRYALIPVKSLHGSGSMTPRSMIVDLITTRKINWSSVDPARFFTHATSGEEKGSLGPVVIWLCVIPGSTSSDTAHEVSQEILTLLREHGVKDAVVEWREAVLRGWQVQPLCAMRSTNSTHHIRRFLTALLGIPLATQGMEDFVRVCGVRRIQRCLDKIKKHISDHGIRADFDTREIDGLEAIENQDEEVVSEINANRRNLNGENEAIRQLEALSTCDIGYVQHAEAVKVDVEGGTRYTSDWGALLAAEAKVKDQFEGNVVDLGSKYSPEDLMAMFYPRGGRKLRIVGCATKEDLANPTKFDSEGERCLIVGKDGNTTDLTVGRYAGLVSFTFNEVGIVSVELGIYNSGLKNAEVFFAKGDSGSLVWHTKDGKAYIVGQLHSGENKGGSTSNHTTYCTPGWYQLPP